jgi:hypothetical protein
VHLDGTPDARIARLGALQRGRVSTSQLTAAGVTRRMIARRVAGGSLVPLHGAVYAVGHAAPVPLGDETAALLACGHGAVLSHLTAAAVWGLLPAAEGPIHVTVPAGSGVRGREGITAHRSRTLSPDDVAFHEGLPIVSAARALLEIAALGGRSELERALDEGLACRRTTRAQVAAVLARSGRRPGARGLAALLGARSAGTGVTRSRANARFLAIVRAAGLPEPEANVRLLGFEADFYWPQARVAVEVDGYQWHASRRAFERDRRKDAAFADGEISLTRLTWEQMDTGALAIAARLSRLIAERRSG